MKGYGASTKGAGSCATSAIKGLAPKAGPVDKGPGPKIPAGAPPPSSKGSISYPKSAVGGK